MILHQHATRRRLRPAGGWLVTYADLMTNLVCFFVLIISYSVQDRAKIAVMAGSLREAFGIVAERRYAGDVQLQGVPEARQPGNIRPSPTPTGIGVTDTLAAKPAAGAEGVDAAYAEQSADRRRYAEARDALLSLIAEDFLLKGAGEAVTINLAENGLQIVLPDREGAPMFELGSTIPTPRAVALLRDISKVISPLANRIRIEGHADALGGSAYSPFELTAARANAARKVLESSGFPKDRIAAVTGRGAAEPLYPEDPFAAGNRRIEIVLERAAPLLPPQRSL
jgi:chemotaxis protein MotB